MRIIALVQGHYGERIINHIRAHLPQNWVLERVNAPQALPVIVDEPEEFLPSGINKAELLLALTESEGAAQLIPALASLCKAKATIVPIDNTSKLRQGLKNQLQQELTAAGISNAFPKTFCTLTESTVGFHSNSESYNDEYISLFAQYFGKPKLKIDCPDGKIMTVTIERGAPCGSTHHIAQQLVGISVTEVIPSAGLMAHHYPCLASMEQEQIDKDLYEPLMNVSAYIVNEEVQRAITSN